jgi:hypothetical protein
LEAKRAKKDGTSIVMGKKFYSDLKDEFFAADNPANAFPQPPDTDLVDERLFECLKKVLQHNRDFIPCSTYLAGADRMNTTNLQALLKCTLKVPPGGKNNEATAFLCDVMTFVVRCQHEVSHADTIKILTDHFDSALVKDLAFYRMNDRSASQWWHARKLYAVLVLPKANTDAVMAVGARARDIMNDLEIVGNSSKVGKSLVWKALRDAQQEVHSNIVGETLARLPEGPITEEVLTQNRTVFMQRCRQVGASVSETHRPKDMTMSHMGVEITIPVTSLLEFYSFSLQCHLRTAAVRGRELEGLFCEKELGQQVFAAPSKVSDTLLTETRAARKSCNDFMAGLEPTAANIKAMMEKRSTFLMSLDKYFKIEMRFFAASSGELGLRRVQQLVLDLLPTEAVPKNAAQCLAGFQRHERSELLDFVGSSAAFVFSTGMSLVKSIAEGALPCFQGATDSAFFRSLKLSLSRFAEVDIPEAGEASRKVFGKDAVEYQFNIVKDTVAEGTRPELASLQLLVVFGWLLDAAAQTMVKTWRAQAVADGAAALLQVPGEAASSSSGPNIRRGSAGVACARTTRARELDNMTRALFRR